MISCGVGANIGMLAVEPMLYAAPQASEVILPAAALIGCGVAMSRSQEFIPELSDRIRRKAKELCLES